MGTRKYKSRKGKEATGASGAVGQDGAEQTGVSPAGTIPTTMLPAQVEQVGNVTGLPVGPTLPTEVNETHVDEQQEQIHGDDTGSSNVGAGSGQNVGANNVRVTGAEERMDLRQKDKEKVKEKEKEVTPGDRTPKDQKWTVVREKHHEDRGHGKIKEEVVGHLLTIQQLWDELDTAREAERQREVDFEELRKKMAAAEAEKVLAQSDLNSMEKKYRQEIEGRDRKARKDLHLARVSLAKEYEGVLDVVRGKFEQKKKETAAEILLQETRARIEALTEYSEGGFKLEAELERLKDLEISLGID
ncbi:hypothetical protein Bca101_033903 [Brassica carinata]